MGRVATCQGLGMMKETGARGLSVRVPTIIGCRNLQRDLNQTQNKGRQLILAGSQAARKQDGQALFDKSWGDVENDLAQLDQLAPQWIQDENRDQLAEIKKHVPLLRAAQETAINDAADRHAKAVIKAGNKFADDATPANEAIKKSLVRMS